MNDQEMTEQVEPKKEMKASIFTVNEAISESAGEGAEGEAKKPKVPDYVKRMSKELDDLRDKTSKLINFTDSKQFEAIPPLKRTLLTLQASAMTTYFYVLRLRYELEMLEIKKAWGEDNGKTE